VKQKCKSPKLLTLTCTEVKLKMFLNPRWVKSMEEKSMLRF
jgi:hypothetical protein